MIHHTYVTSLLSSRNCSALQEGSGVAERYSLSCTTDKLSGVVSMLRRVRVNDFMQM
jgi:hypothetical protein